MVSAETKLNLNMPVNIIPGTFAGELSCKHVVTTLKDLS